MIENSKISGHSTLDLVDLCRSLGRGFSADQFGFEDYASNVTSILMDGSQDYWSDCIDCMQESSLVPYLNYLRENVESQDFMPHPRRYLFGRETHEQIKKKKRELCPIYVYLFNIVQTKCGVL